MTLESERSEMTFGPGIDRQLDNFLQNTRKLIEENPEWVDRYRNGEKIVLSEFMKVAMAASKGHINPVLVKSMFLESV